MQCRCFHGSIGLWRAGGAGDSVWFPQTPLIAESGATCETYVNNMTDVAQSSNDGSLKVIITSDAVICAMWNKEIEYVFKLSAPKIKRN